MPRKIWRDAMKYARDVRNRWSFLDLADDAGLLDDFLARDRAMRNGMSDGLGFSQESIVKNYGDVEVVHGIDLDYRGRLLRGSARPVGLRQIDAAAHDRRA